MTPEYSQFVLGIAILSVGAIAVVGWLYIKKLKKEDSERVDAIIASMGNSRFTVFDNHGHKYCGPVNPHSISEIKGKSLRRISGGKSNETGLMPSDYWVYNMDSSSSHHCDSSSSHHSSSDCSSDDNGICDSGGFDGGGL